MSGDMACDISYKTGKAVGRLDDGTMVRVNRAIALRFGLAA
jgi:uncharacterized protein YacL